MGKSSLLQLAIKYIIAFGGNCPPNKRLYFKVHPVGKDYLADCPDDRIASCNDYFTNEIQEKCWMNFFQEMSDDELTKFLELFIDKRPWNQERWNKFPERLEVEKARSIKYPVEE